MIPLLYVIATIVIIPLFVRAIYTHTNRLPIMFGFVPIVITLIDMIVSSNTDNQVNILYIITFIMMWLIITILPNTQQLSLQIIRLQLTVVLFILIDCVCYRKYVFISIYSLYLISLIIHYLLLARMLEHTMTQSQKYSRLVSG